MDVDDEILCVNIERAQVAQVCIIQTLLDNTDEDEALRHKVLRHIN